MFQHEWIMSSSKTGTHKHIYRERQRGKKRGKERGLTVEKQIQRLYNTAMFYECKDLHSNLPMHDIPDPHMCLIKFPPSFKEQFCSSILTFFKRIFKIPTFLLLWVWIMKLYLQSSFDYQTVTETGLLPIIY